MRVAPGKVATAGIDIISNIRPAVGSHFVDGDGLGLVNLICRDVVVVKDKLAHDVKIIGLGGLKAVQKLPCHSHKSAIELN